MNVTSETAFPSPTPVSTLLFSPFAAAVLGAAFHISTLNVELDDHGWLLLGGCNLIFLSSIYVSAQLSQIGWLAATLQVLPLAASALAGLLASIVLWRLFLSPTRKFPGPWLGKLTKFHTVGLQAKNMQLFLEVQKLHEKYGDFVRTGPREISILRPSAIPLIYGAKSRCRKATFYNQNGGAEEEQSLIMMRNIQNHNRLRRTFDLGFSTKALVSYGPRLKALTDRLLDQISSRKEVDITDWTAYFAFDVMGGIAFNKNYGMVEKGNGVIESHKSSVSIEALHNTMKMIGLLGPVPWLLRMLAQTKMGGDFSTFREWCWETMRKKQAMWKHGDIPTDITSYLIKAREESDPSTRQSQTSLEQDSVLLIIAGSDTTASAAANALYYLARDPALYEKLQTLVDAAFPNGEADWTHEKVREISYIDNVINETLRLKPSACENLIRETPAGGITVDGVHIPGGVNVSVPTWAIHRDERHWEQPEKFNPDRFDGVNLSGDQLPFIPFSKGIFACPGKTLAFMELRSVLSRIAMRFDLAFAEGETGEEFDKGALDTFTLTNKPLRLVFTERKK